jgi:alanine racemase
VRKFREMRAKAQAEMIATSHQGRPTLCSIDLDALSWNFRQIKTTVGPGVQILAMVKADAYGHGAPKISKTLAAENCDGFGVATLEEALELRRGGIGKPIVVVAGAYLDQIDGFVKHKLTPAVHDAATLNRLEEALRSNRAELPVHLKIDSGMGRLGFLPAELGSWLPQLKNLKAVRIEGVFSHFSYAESVEGRYTLKQLEIFKEIIEHLRSASITPRVIHLANSAATITLPSARFDMVRPGLILYGVYPSPAMAQQIALKPVLSWKTRVLQLKKVPAGTSISYGQTFVTERDSTIATLPVGYADGYARLLSNRGAVLVGGKRAPIAGRVCMDLTMVDVTGIAGVQPGDEVVLLGRQGDQMISADEMAGWANTISYEILTSISARVPRIHHNS